MFNYLFQIFSEFCEQLTKLLEKEANQRFGFDDRIQLSETVKPEEDLDDSFLRSAHVLLPALTIIKRTQP